MNQTTKQNRFRSWALWVSVAGALWVIASAFGIPEKIGITHSTFTTVLDAIGSILIAFGIVNNPTDRSSL
ncbi:MAG: holin [Clostridiales bacterium]|nr:holin [Clostridiales bacterium]